MKVNNPVREYFHQKWKKKQLEALKIGEEFHNKASIKIMIKKAAK